MGRYSSGQRGQTVNLLAFAYAGSSPARPTRTKQEGFLKARAGSFQPHSPKFLTTGQDNLTLRRKRSQHLITPRLRLGDLIKKNQKEKFSIHFFIPPQFLFFNKRGKFFLLAFFIIRLCFRKANGAGKGKYIMIYHCCA